MEKLGKFELIPIEKIVVSGRLRKDLGDIEDLKKSIKLAGSIMPILVRPLEDGRYKLVVGERRLVALKQLGYSEVPAIIRPYDPLMAELVEIEENVRRKDYDSVEKAKAIARYYEIVKQILGEPKPGRPEALTPEQVEKAKQLREQGKSLREIADEFGVSHMAVQRATEQPVTKSIHDESISLQESVAVPEKISETRILPEGPATRAVAEELGVSQPTVVRAVKTVEAIRKYPVLERLGKSSYVNKLAEIADFWKMSKEQVETAVNLILNRGVGPEFAASLSRLPPQQREKLLEICEKEKVPEDVANVAARGLIGTPGVGATPEIAVKEAFSLKCVMFKVPIVGYAVLKGLEKAAEDAKVDVETYIALAALEKLLIDGYIKDSYYQSAAEILRTKLYEKV